MWKSFLSLATRLTPLACSRFCTASIFAIFVFGSQQPVNRDAALAVDKAILKLSEQSKPDREQAIKVLAKRLKQFPVKYAVPLATNLAIDGAGDSDPTTLQLIATTLSETLRSLPPGDRTSQDSFEKLAELVLYAHTKISFHDRRYRNALTKLEERDGQLNEANFELSDTNGDDWNLKDLRGKVVLVNFWATWCPPCRAELPDLNELSERFKGKGLIILGISDEGQPTLERFLAQNRLRYPVLLDPGDVANKRFLVPGFPKSYIYDRDGRLASQSIDRPSKNGFLDMLWRAGLR